MLATYGIDSKGKLYVHVKIYKQSRIYGEIVMEGGPVKLRCRNCLRWHIVNFQDQTASITETKAPEAQAPDA